MQFVFGVILAVHGLAHLVGFAVAWQIATFEEMPYKTTILAGAVDLGHVGIRFMGALWLAVAVAFVTVAVGAFVGASWWFPSALLVTAFSLLMTILGWPDSRIGVAVNIVLLVALTIIGRFAWRAL